MQSTDKAPEYTDDQKVWFEAYEALTEELIKEGSPETQILSPELIEKAQAIGASVMYFDVLCADEADGPEKLALVLDERIATTALGKDSGFDSSHRPYGGLPVFLDRDTMELAWDLGLGEFLLNADGDVHRTQKDVIEVPLRRSAIEGIGAHVQQLAEETVGKIKRQVGEFDVSPIIREIPFGVMCGLLDIEPESEEAKELLELAPEVTNFDGNPLALIRTREIISTIVGEKKIEETGEDAIIMKAVLEAKNNDKIDEKQTQELFVQIFLAGLESTEALLTNAFIEHVTGVEQNAATVPRVRRTANRDVVLVDANGVEWSFKNDGAVLIDLYAIDTASTEADESRPLNFGRGNHACPGENLAAIQLHLLKQALQGLEPTDYSLEEAVAGNSGLSANYQRVVVRK